MHLIAAAVISSPYLHTDHTYGRTVTEYLARVEYLRTCSASAGGYSGVKPFPPVSTSISKDPAVAGREGTFAIVASNWLKATAWPCRTESLQKRRVSVLAETFCRTNRVWALTGGDFVGITGQHENYVDVCQLDGGGLEVGEYDMRHTTQANAKYKNYTPGSRYKVSVTAGSSQGVTIQVYNRTVDQLLPMESKWNTALGTAVDVPASAKRDAYFTAPPDPGHDMEVHLVNAPEGTTVQRFQVLEETRDLLQEGILISGLSKLRRLYKNGGITDEEIVSASAMPGLNANCTFSSYPTTTELNQGVEGAYGIFNDTVQSRLNYLLYVWSAQIKKWRGNTTLTDRHDGTSSYPGASMPYNIQLPVAYAYHQTGDYRGSAMLSTYKRNYDGHINYWDILLPDHEADGGYCGSLNGRPTKRVLSPSRFYEDFGYMGASMAAMKAAGFRSFGNFINNAVGNVLDELVIASDGAPWVAERFQEGFVPTLGAERRSSSWSGWISVSTATRDYARHRIDQNYGWPCVPGVGFENCIAAYETECPDSLCVATYRLCPESSNRSVSTAGASSSATDTYVTISVTESQLAAEGECEQGEMYLGTNCLQ